MKKVLLREGILIRENLAELLELASYDIHTEAEGKQGVELVVTHQPDIFVGYHDACRAGVELFA